MKSESFSASTLNAAGNLTFSGDPLATFTPRSARKAAAIIILVMALATTFLVVTSYHAEKDDIGRLLSSTASAFDFQLDRNFRAVEDLLTDAAGRIDQDHWPDATLIPWLEGRLSAFPEINNVLLVRPDGSSLTPSLTLKGGIDREIDVSDREYFRYHLSHPADHRIHIGDPIVSRLDGRPGIPVSKALFDRQGKFAGVIRVLLNSEFLSKGLAVTRVGRDGYNTVVRADGMILARAPDDEGFVGRSVASGPLFRDIVSRNKIGVGEFISPLDGKLKIVAYRTLDHYPLVVVTAVPRWDALAEWRSRLYGGLGLLSGLSLALSLVAGWSDRRERQRALLSAAALQAQLHATQAQQQFTDAIETISDGFAYYDSQDRLVMCNGHYRAMFTGAEDVIQPGNRFADIVRMVGERGIYCYEGAALEEFLTARIAEHTAPTGRSLLHPVGRGRWIVSKEFRTRDGGVVATRTDVTELKQREEEMEALKLRYELILDSAGDGIIGIDRTEAITFANQAACRMLGVSPHGLDRINYRQALSGAENAGTLPVFPLASEREISGEASFLVVGNGDFVAEYVLAPIHEGQTFTGAVLVFRDISLRKQYEATIADHQKDLERQVAERTRTLSREIEQRSRTEEALRKSQGRLLGITANLFEGVLLVDVYGHILFANRSAQRLLVGEGQALAGIDLDEVMRVRQGGEPVDFAQSPLHRAIETGETQIDDDAVFVTRTQTLLKVGFAVAPLEEEGKRRGAVISFRNIEALKAAQREALQSSRLASVGQLAAGIAHEINTPIQYIGDNLRFMRDSFQDLAAVIAGQQALLQGTDRAAMAVRLADEKDIDYLLQEIPLSTVQSLQGVDHVAHIVRSMKEFSHPGTTAKVATDINHAIDSTLTVSRAEWKHVAMVETDLDSSLPPIVCFPADVNQVLLNLIVNAAHAIGATRPATPGIIRISTRLDGDCVEIRVADSGPGVPEAIRDKIFDPFFTTKEVGKGTGQGLAICLDVVVNKHGGKIHIDETVASGATFVVRLPIKEIMQQNEVISSCEDDEAA